MPVENLVKSDWTHHVENQFSNGFGSDLLFLLVVLHFCYALTPIVWFCLVFPLFVSYFSLLLFSSVVIKFFISQQPVGENRVASLSGFEKFKNLWVFLELLPCSSSLR